MASTYYLKDAQIERKHQLLPRRQKIYVYSRPSFQWNIMIIIHASGTPNNEARTKIPTSFLQS